MSEKQLFLVTGILTERYESDLREEPIFRLVRAEHEDEAEDIFYKKYDDGYRYARKIKVTSVLDGDEYD